MLIFLLLTEVCYVLCIQASNVKHESPSADGLTMYKTLFKHKRAEHLTAVKTIIGFNNYEKQYKMVYVMVKKIAEILANNKIILEASEYIPGADFPLEQNIREALGQTVENTAFFGDILLKLPDITHDILEKEKTWSVVLKWSLGWSNSTGIYDKKTTELINLVAQELYLVEKDPNYINPYRKESQKILHEDQPKLPAKKAKKKLNKGPHLSGSRHSEL